VESGIDEVCRVVDEVVGWGDQSDVTAEIWNFG
jgi:hypothetical protein